MKKIITPFLLFLMISVSLSAKNLEDYIQRTFVGPNGKEIVEIKVPDGRPPIGYRRNDRRNIDELRNIRNVVILDNVPSFDWSYGCSATAAAMQAGYYDRTTYPNMYAGPTNNGLMPLNNSVWGESGGGEGASGECPLSATHQGYDDRTIFGHADDFWIEYGSSEQDPYISDNLDQHVLGDCTGDYMGTNQSYWSNTDGSTTFYNNTDGAPLNNFSECEDYTTPRKDGCHGLRDFYESRGYSIVTNYNQYILGYNDNTQGFTFDQFMDEIDAGRPLLIHVVGHTMLAVGYNSETEEIYINNTWDYSTHTMQWGGIYYDMQHYAVSVIELIPNETPDGIPVTFNLFDSYGDGWGYLEQENYIEIEDYHITYDNGTEEQITIYLNPGEYTYTYTANDGYGDENSWTITLADGTEIGSGEGGDNGTTEHSFTLEEESETYLAPVNLAIQQNENNTIFNWEMPNDGDEFEEGFEYEILENWINIDNDEDQNSWLIYDLETVAHSGDACAASASWTITTGPLSPDNWLISSEITVSNTSELHFWAAAQDPNYPSDHYSVKISTSGTDLANFTDEVFTETLVDDVWHEIVVDLSDYSGETINIAWQHHDSYDMFYMKIDDVSVINSDTREILFSNNFDTYNSRRLQNKSYKKFQQIDNQLVPQNSRILENFNVFLNDVLVGSTAEMLWEFSELEIGETYTFGVQAIYTDGLSEISSITYTVNEGEILLGDVDFNEEVNSFDAALTLQYSIELDPLPTIDPIPWEQERLIAAEVSGDEIISAFDAALILQYGVGIIDVFPIETRETAPENPDITISIEDDCFVFAVDNDLIGFSVSTSEENIVLGTPQISNWSNTLSVINNENGFRFGIASTESVTNNVEFLRIPFSNAICDEITFEVSANDNSQTITVPNILDNENNQTSPLIDNLSGNYPNPFNPTTTISYSVANENYVEIVIYNVKGQKVKTLVNETIKSGNHNVTWNGDNFSQSKVSSGIYFCKTKIGKKEFIKKLILMK